MPKVHSETKSKEAGRVKRIARLFGGTRVFQSGEKWITRKGLSRRVFSTQDEAITYARRITKRGDKKVVLDPRNGEIVKIRFLKNDFRVQLRNRILFFSREISRTT